MNNLDIYSFNKQIKDDKIKLSELIGKKIKTIKNDTLNDFITVNEEIKLPDQTDSLLYGVPIAVNDNISTKDLRTTAASKILEDYVPVFDATVVSKLKAKNAYIIGKTNMDEFAMGEDGTNSYFGKTLNPLDKNRIVGSAAGSAVAVKSGHALAAIATDTGGFARKSASFMGLVAMKPTYGLVSRFGVAALASSLDTVSPLTLNVQDNILLLDSIMGYDANDMTTTDKRIELNESITTKNLKIAVPKLFMNLASKKVQEKLTKLISYLKNNGFVVEEVEPINLEYVSEIYSAITAAEASSNMARYDGIRYGYQKKGIKNLDELYEETRSEAFGKELKKTIILGTYLLMDTENNYYEKAQEIRKDLCTEFENIFKKYDLIIGPTTSDIAPIFASDYDHNKDIILNAPANLTGMPSLTLPLFKVDKLPVGLQIIGAKFNESKIYNLAKYLEENYVEEENV